MDLNRSYSNPARLSLSQVEELKGDISKLLAGPSNLEVRADGRIFIKPLNKYYTGGGNIKVDLLDENDLLYNSFTSISECAKYLGLSVGTVNKRFRDNQAIYVANKKLFIHKRRDNESIV